MPINQVSKIKIRSGLQQNLPLLDQGEMCLCIDTLRLFIGNGTVANGAPIAGNTEILTAASSTNSNPPATTPVSGSWSGNGTTTSFVLPSSPFPHTLLVWRSFPLIPNVPGGYTVAGDGVTVTFLDQSGNPYAPTSTEYLYYQYWIA